MKSETTMQINFPGIGLGTVSLYHSAENPGKFLGGSWTDNSMSNALKRIAEETNITIHFPHGTEIKVNGVKYCRLYISLQSWQGDNGLTVSSRFNGAKIAEDGKPNYSHDMTDKAKEMLRTKFGPALAAMYKTILPEARAQAQKEYIDKVEAEMRRMEDSFAQTRLFISLLEGKKP